MAVKVFCVTLMQEQWGVIQSPAADYFFRCIGATDQDRGICSPAKQAGFRSVYGDTLAIKPQEAQHSDCIVLWGINATATDVHILHDVNIAKRMVPAFGLSILIKLYF